MRPRLCWTPSAAMVVVEVAPRLQVPARRGRDTRTRRRARSTTRVSCVDATQEMRQTACRSRGMRILLAFFVACSAPDVREPQPILGARLVCSDVSPSCFGDIHATFYATPESRERVVANVLESLPGATLDENNAINWRDT